MALLKSIDTPTGVDAIYWRIRERHDDYDAGTIQCVVFGYASEEAGKARKAPLLERTIVIVLQEGQQFEEFGRPELYDILKTYAPPMPPAPAMVNGEMQLITPPSPPAMFAEASAA